MRRTLKDMLKGGLAGLALGAFMGLGLPYPGVSGTAFTPEEAASAFPFMLAGFGFVGLLAGLLARSLRTLRSRVLLSFAAAWVSLDAMARSLTAWRRHLGLFLVAWVVWALILSGIVSADEEPGRLP